MRREIALRAVKTTAAGLDLLRPRARGVTILIYHRVGGRSGLEVDLPAPLFAAQVARLAESGRVVTLDRAAELLLEGGERSGGGPDTDPVVVTFDDGTADFVDQALPVLERHRVPVVLYAATAFIEESRPFPDDGKPVSWAALEDARSTGLVTVGSHTHTHALLDRLDGDAVGDELDRSIRLIEERLGATPRHFAYPKALAGSPAAEHAVRRRFDTAALAGTRVNRYGRADLHRLSRSPIQVADGMRWFQKKLDGGMAFEDGLRRLANRRRYAGATT